MRVIGVVSVVRLVESKNSGSSRKVFFGGMGIERKNSSLGPLGLLKAVETMECVRGS